jgi:hypothetical protein
MHSEWFKITVKDDEKAEPPEPDRTPNDPTDNVPANETIFIKVDETDKHWGASPKTISISDGTAFYYTEWVPLGRPQDSGTASEFLGVYAGDGGKNYAVWVDRLWKDTGLYDRSDKFGEAATLDGQWISFSEAVTVGTDVGFDAGLGVKLPKGLGANLNWSITVRKDVSTENGKGIELDERATTPEREDSRFTIAAMAEWVYLRVVEVNGQGFLTGTARMIEVGGTGEYNVNYQDEQQRWWLDPDKAEDFAGILKDDPLVPGPGILPDVDDGTMWGVVGFWSGTLFNNLFDQDDVDRY